MELESATTLCRGTGTDPKQKARRWSRAAAFFVPAAAIIV
jgi:hypothetical protein